MSRACLEANYDNHVGSSMFGFDMECSNSYQGHTNNIQLSPEGEVNSGGYMPRCEASRYIYPPLFTNPEGGSGFSIYQIRWIKKSFFNFFF